MAYIKQIWENLPSTNTPISADRLNHMEDGIAEAWEHGGGGAGETLPVGSEIDFDGQTSDIPTGWEQITNPFEWQLIDTKTGNASVTLPSTFNELLCVSRVDNMDVLTYTLYVPYFILPSSGSISINGGYYGGSGGQSGACRIEVSKTSANMSMAYKNGGDALSTSVTSYYYR